MNNLNKSYNLKDLLDKDEIYKFINGYENRYIITNKAKVISFPCCNCKEYVIKAKDINKGYHRVSLWKNGKGKSKLVHQLVGLAFIDNPENKPHINHIDGNKTNNNISNLEWCTPKENIYHSIKTGLAGTNSHRKHKTNTSGYIGVNFHKHMQKWVARIRLADGKRKSLGYFNSKEEAAKAYDNAVEYYYNNTKPRNFT